jgi:hypothetical protein
LEAQAQLTEELAHGEHRLDDLRQRRHQSLYDFKHVMKSLDIDE